MAAEINRFDLLEFDGPRVSPTDHDAPIVLDMVDRGGACNLCGKVAELNDMAQCRDCFERVNEDMQLPPPAPLDLTAIAAESATNAAGKRNQTAFVAPTFVGNSDVPAVDSGASDVGIAAMKRAAAEQATRNRTAAEALEIQRRADAEVARIAAEQLAAEARPALNRGDMVAGASAEGHGVLVGWRGAGDLTRAQIASTLAGAGLPSSWIPEAVSARSQASRALSTLGLEVTPEKKSKAQVVEITDHDWRWIVSRPNYGGGVGDKSGDIVLVATLVGDRLDLDGEEELAALVRAEYSERIGSEICKSSDITGWLQSVILKELDGVRYGVGWYVPRRHAATANTLCQAFERAGFGAEDSWISPALPVATGDELRSGLLKGLSSEVAAVVRQVAMERDTARTKEDRDDIGNKRAATFLGQLRTVGKRVIAFGNLLGADRVATLRDTIRAAIENLESSLSEEDAAIVSRFQNIWDELEIDRRNNGGVL